MKKIFYFSAAFFLAPAMLFANLVLPPTIITKGRGYVAVDLLSGIIIPVAYDPINEPVPGVPAYRSSITVTSVDWEAISGMRVREHKITFTNRQIAGFGKDGWELYYLDSFPCWGTGQWVRTWVNSSTQGLPIYLLCIRPPERIKLAYRPSQLTQSQGKTLGVLNCEIERDSSVRLDQCEKLSWQEFMRDDWD